MRRRDVLAGAALMAGCVTLPDARRPIVIAHRGASGERPEHTLSAYRLAIDQGADFIEPDLVQTKDGVLVCRHENEISETTDVAAKPEFSGRRTTKFIDGQAMTGWFVEDFTLAELKTLRAKERLPQLRPGNMAYDGQDEVPTFAEVIALANERNVGLYPELKHPTALKAAGLDPVTAFIGAVRDGGGPDLADKMFVQCFEVGALKQLAAVSSIQFACVQLIASDAGPFDRQDLTPNAMLSDAGLAEIAGYARGIGVEKVLIVPRDGEGRSQTRTDLVRRTHARGLLVHAWTFRAENYFLPLELRRGDASAPDYMRQHGDLDAELRAFYGAGVDGVFSDFPGIAVEALA